MTTYMLCLPLGGLAAYNGYKLATEQFNKVNEMTIYESRTSQWRVRSNFRWMGAIGYSFPVMIRTFTFVTFLLGVPALLGVYHDDTDYVSHYVGSSGVGALVVSLMTTNREFKGVRPKVVAAILAMVPGLFAGVFLTQAQKYDVYPFYESYQERWRTIDPLWADFVEKQGESEKSLPSEEYNGTLDKVEEALQSKENIGILDKVKEALQGKENIGILDKVKEALQGKENIGILDKVEESQQGAENICAVLDEVEELQQGEEHVDILDESELLVKGDVNDAVSEISPVDTEK